MAGPKFDLEASEEFSRRWDEAVPVRLSCYLNSLNEEGVTVDDLDGDERNGDVLWDQYLRGGPSDQLKADISGAYDRCLGAEFVYQSPEEWMSLLEKSGKSFW